MLTKTRKLYLSLFLLMITMTSCRTVVRDSNKVSLIKVQGFTNKLIPQFIQLQDHQSLEVLLQYSSQKITRDSLHGGEMVTVFDGDKVSFLIIDSLSNLSLLLEYKLLLPKLSVSFIGSRGRYFSEENIDRISFLENDGLSCSLVNHDIDVYFPVESFNISLIQDGYIHNFTSSGRRLSREQRKVISELSRSTTICFEDILVNVGSEELVFAPPIYLHLIVE